MTADIAKQRYTSSYDWTGGSGHNVYSSSSSTEWNKWHGGDGDDYLKSSLDSHIYNGGNARDIIVGGAGADTINGGNGTDTLTGGDGIDRFALKLDTAAGTDTITDFSVEDGDTLLVDTANGDETTLAGLGITAQANGSNSANADLVYSNTVIATLNGIDHNDITDANFANYFEVI